MSLEDDWFLCEREQEEVSSSAGAGAGAGAGRTLASVSVASLANLRLSGNNNSNNNSNKRPELLDFTVVNFSLDEPLRRSVPDVIVEDLVPSSVKVEVAASNNKASETRPDAHTAVNNTQQQQQPQQSIRDDAEVEALRQRLRETEIKLRHSEALLIVAKKQRERAEERAKTAEKRVAVVERRLADAIKQKELATAHKLSWSVQRKETKSHAKRKQLALKQSEAQQQVNSSSSKRDVWTKSNHRTACSAMRKV